MPPFSSLGGCGPILLQQRVMNSSTQTLLKTLLANPSAIKTESQATQLHALIVKTRRSSSLCLATLLSVYTNFNLLEESLSLFHSLPSPPPKAWKSLIKCYTSNGFFYESLHSFVEMRASGKYPDRNVFPSVLKACTHLRDLRFGESVHGFVLRYGLDYDLYTGNALMNMYVKLQGSDDLNLFDETLQTSELDAFEKASLANNVPTLTNLMSRDETSAVDNDVQKSRHFLC